ncbi:MAG TPA: MFS transporter, partial [Methylocystis sp.]|nr:MFS transporter [Methylocystis sp.]
SGKHGAFLLFHLFAVALVFAGMGFLSGFWPLLAAVGLLAFAQGPINSLADGMILGAVQRRGRAGRGTLHYSFVRGWGSFAILVVMLAGGPVAAAVPSDALIYLLAGVASLAALGGLSAVNGLRDFQASPARSRAEPLARPGLVVLVICAAALILASHALSFSFAALHWKAKGFSETFLSLAWVAAVAAEVGFFLLAGRWFGGERNAALHLTAAGAAAVLRWLIMASDPGAAGIIATQALHGLSCAAAQLGPAYLLARLAGTSRLAQAQGWLAATYSAIQALTTLSCGPVYTLYGERSYFAMAAMAAAGLSLALVVMRSADVPAPLHPKRDGPDAS